MNQPYSEHQLEHNLSTEKLQKHLNIMAKQQAEERLFFVLAIVLLLNCNFLPDIHGWAGPFVILIVELFLFLAFAGRLGTNLVATWLDKAIKAIQQNQSIM